MPPPSLSILIVGIVALVGDDPFADQVISYDEGANPAKGFTDPQTSLGQPERFTGEGIFPSVVSAFNPPFGTDEVVSIGTGGQLTVEFDTPVTDDPNNPYGIDLLIFGNTGFIDSAYPNGVVGGVFGNEGGTVEVSSDRRNWVTVPKVTADNLWPTIGFMDSGAYDSKPGTVLTDFSRPIDPALTIDHFVGLANAQVVEIYRGSGGGVGIDLASVGLSEISFVRITNPKGNKESIEVDALSDVSPRIPGDVNLDSLVNVDDLLLVISTWGRVEPGAPPADFNYDGVVNVDDLLAVINHWSSQSL